MSLEAMIPVRAHCAPIPAVAEENHPVGLLSRQVGRTSFEVAPDPDERLHMSDKPMFMFAAVYDDVSGADADYEAIKALHAGDAIGSYDSAIISKQADGKVKVTKTEKPTQHGAWTGLAAGAGAAVLFPFLLPGLTVLAWRARAPDSAHGSDTWPTAPAGGRPRRWAPCSTRAMPHSSSWGSTTTPSASSKPRRTPSGTC